MMIYFDRATSTTRAAGRDERARTVDLLGGGNSDQSTSIEGRSHIREARGTVHNSIVINYYRGPGNEAD